jgi:hypothetical protein
MLAHLHMSLALEKNLKLMREGSRIQKRSICILLVKLIGFKLSCGVENQNCE